MRSLVCLSVGLLFLSCGGNKDEGPCGTVMCALNQMCDRGSTPPVCRCLAEYAPPSCMSCARGYFMPEPGICQPMPIDCRLNSRVCQPGGVCVTGSGGVPDQCMCSAAHTGHTCQTCAQGFQDNDKNGTCMPSCTSMATSCLPPRTCSDTTGAAACTCPANTTGASCELCAAGFVRGGDGMCVATCAPPSTACGPRRVCDTSQAIAMCVCQAGHTGPDCTTCLPGYMLDTTGRCVAGVPAGTSFIAAGQFQGTPHLLAINTQASTATALRPLPTLTQIQALAADAATRTVYAAVVSGSSTSINRLDVNSGTLTPIMTLVAAGTLTFGGGALWTVPNLAPYLLKRIDPATGAVMDPGPTGLANATGLAWESTGTLLLARRSAQPGAGPEIHRVNALNGSATSQGTVMFQGMRLRPADSNSALAIEPRSGRPFLVARVGRTPEEILTDYCVKLATGLGLAGYENAPLTTIEYPRNGIGPGITKALSSQGTSGREIIAYASSGVRAAKAFLRVETANPDAFVCLSTSAETLELVVAAAARFAGIGLSGVQPTLSLVVESGFPAQTKATLHVYTSSSSAIIDSSVRAYAPFSRVYTAAEWNERRLPTAVTVWDTDTAAPVRLVEVDPATWGAARTSSFAGVDLLPLLAPWAP